MGMEVDIALLVPCISGILSHIFWEYLYLVAPSNVYRTFVIDCSSLWVLDPPCHNLATEHPVNFNEFTTGIEQDTLG